MPDLLSESGGANGAPGSPRQANGVPVRQRSRRKQSSPMMPPFMVSAPGKVIVFGEHAVVHGKVSALYNMVPGGPSSPIGPLRQARGGAARGTAQVSADV
ncbi:hypothetical protein IMZ48_39600 [Candidatus Bathyarchaeota archaeon]|nr:hypothetical protein [Candidatus Bathyarchaeota archaeon]